ncbi:MAG: patatin-like phospholipase family protein [Acidobacteriota bacterium]
MRQRSTARAAPRRLRRWAWLMLAIALVTADIAFGQASAAPAVEERPRTCLVLSGGGARGAAHIGVLQVLEAQRVPIDCVVGTSMGAIVGGLYASGLSPDDIAQVIRDTDWESIFAGTSPRRQVDFRRKQDDRLALLPIELGIGRGGVKTFIGLVSDQKIRFTLRQLTLHTAGLPHFDALRLPYRAVAANLADGSPVVLADGSLAAAMRASMAVPGIFAPMRRDGVTLVDGGVAANLPVEVALQDLEAERIIAVDLGASDVTEDPGESVLSVLYQTLDLLTSRNVAASKQRLRASDALIEPDLGDVSSTDFNRVAEAIRLGEASAQTQIAVLADFVVSEAAFARHLQRQRRQLADDPAAMVIDEIVIAASDRVDTRQIERRLRAQAGAPLDVEALGADLSAIYEIGEFSYVDFEIAPSETGRRLAIDLGDKPWGPGYIRPGLTFSANLDGDSDFLALLQYRRAQLNALGAELKMLLTIGDSNAITTEFFQPLDYVGRWFVRPRFEVLEDQFVDTVGDTGRIDVETVSVGLDLGVHLGNYAELQVGVEYTDLTVESQRTGAFDEALGGARFSFTFDQLDDVDFPRSGSLAVVDLFFAAEALGSSTDYERLEVDLLHAWSMGSHSLLGRARYGTVLGSGVLPVTDAFELGGFFNLSGYQQRALRGDALAFVSVGYSRAFGSLRVGAQLEAGNIWPTRAAIDVDDLIGSVLLYVGRDTLLGPLYLGYGVAEDRDSLYLFLGRTF